MVKCQKKKQKIFLTSLLFTILLLCIITSSNAKTTNNDTPSYSSSLSPLSLSSSLESEDTAISKVDLLINIHYLIAKVNQTIEYLQVNSNASKYIDTIYLKGNINNVTVIDNTKNNLLISNTYEEDIGYSRIILQLSRVLTAGERYQIFLSYIDFINSSSGLREFDFHTVWSKKASVFSALVYLDKDLILYSSNPEPQTITPIDQRLRLTWDTVQISNFELLIHFKSTHIGKSITITPIEWKIGYIPKTAKKVYQIFTIFNLLEQPIEIDITTNVTWLEHSESVVIDALESKNILVTLELKQIGKLEATILFQSNVTAEPLVCEVNVYVLSSVNGWFISSLILMLGFIGLGLYLVYYQYVEEKKKIAKRKYLQTQHGRTENQQKKKYDLSAIVQFFNEKELLVIQEILEKPGSTQVNISKSTEISKATLSRIIEKLDRKGIITKKFMGMSNFLFINKKSSVYNLIEIEEEEE